MIFFALAALRGSSPGRFCFGVSLMGVLMLGMSGEASTRVPAVAGAFYPADARTLRENVGKMLRDAPRPKSGGIAALVVPHAGYVYSGETAACAFRCLEGQKVKRVILLGPSHHLSFSGAALPGRMTTAFETPLGLVELDLPSLKKLRRHSVFAGPPRAHDAEHSLEVQLPFIQVILPKVKILPVLIGASSSEHDLQAIAAELGAIVDSQTVVVVSSDFSHFGAAYRWTPFEVGPGLKDRLAKLRETNAALIAAIQPFAFRKQVKISGDTICGRDPIYILLELLSHAFSGEGRVVGSANSGDLTGDYSQAVSYASIVFSGSWRTWMEATLEQRTTFSKRASKAVPALARSVLASSLGHGPELAAFYLEYGDLEELLQPAGAFVTLNHRGLRPGSPGRLRACMGLMDTHQSLQEAVIEAALSASGDPRFPPLRLEELSDLKIEVSVLSVSRPVSSYRDIVVGRHGVILSKNGRRAVFLPQVASEQGWDRETMLSQLSRKAGLSPDAWRTGTDFEIFEATVFEED